jgi:hypothetical protein
MDYERKYKELVANFKSVLNLRTVKENGAIPTEDVRKLIPELQTSNDGEIIKELIDYLDVQDTLSKGKDSDFKNWIAWLKKQKEKEPDTRSNYLEELIVADDIYQMAMNDAMVEEAKTKAMHALSNLKISNLLFQEREEKRCTGLIKELNNYIENTPENKREKDWNELKPYSNPDSNKFKIGTWITDGNEVGIVIPWSEGCIGYKTIYGTEKAFRIDQSHLWHIWTINDANDGDVLVFKYRRNYVIGIVKPINGLHPVDAYCLIENLRFKKGMFYNLDTEDPHPATNEQRNTLIEKMKEAGYEWDEEKKELKKLSEQNGTDILEKEILNIYDRYDADELYRKY